MPSRLVEGLAGAAILGVALCSEAVAVATGVLDEGFKERLFGAAPPPETWGSYLAPARGFEAYIVYEIVRCFAAHAGSYLLLGACRDAWGALQKENNRQILARGVMNVCFLAACGYRGCAMWRGWAADAGWTTVGQAASHVHSALTVGCDAAEGSWLTFWKASDGAGCAPLYFVPATAHARLYDYDASFQRLAVVMFAFQIKNLADTVYFGDGAVFVVHHVVTLTVALFALHPYSHLYGSFFFGVSEVSTTVLAVVVLFDAEHGVAELERDFPTLRVAIGGLFAVSFAFVRCVLWPYLTYFYCRDALDVLADDPQIHSPFLVKLFMGGLLTLSVMQAVWLFQIVERMYVEIKALLKPKKA